MKLSLKHCLVVLGFVLACLLSHSIDQVMAANITVTSGHPRILISQDKLGALSSRAATSHSDLYAILKNWCDDKWNDPTGRKMSIGGDFKYDAGVLRYALIYVLGEIDGFDYSQHSVNDYGDMAVTILLDIAASGSNNWATLGYSAIAYDWVNPRINLDQKSVIVNYFVSKCGTTPSLESVNGYRFSQTPRSMYPGLAFYGDGINDSQAQIYLDFIPTWLNDLSAVCHMAGEDGGHAAGLAYAKYAYGTGYHLAQDLYALVTGTDMTIDDTFNTYEYMNGFPTWILYGLQPGPRSPAKWYDGDVATVTKTDDCGTWLWNVDKNDGPLMKALRIMAHVAKEQDDTTKAQWITWLINERFQAPSQISTFDIIFNDKSIQAIPPNQAGLPTCKAFGWNETLNSIDTYLNNPKAGIGQIYMKSSWDQGPNTTHALFKAFPYYYFGHSHFDSLSFSIFKGEPLVLQNSGVYYHTYEGGDIDQSAEPGFPHHWYYYERTVSANTLLVLDPEETIRTSGHSQVIKDGGQRMLYDGSVSWGSNIPQTDRDWGGLIRYEETDNYTFSSADATKGYNSTVNGVNYLTSGANPKVSLVQRDFVYLKSDNGESDYFVVFDRVDSTDPSFRKVFLLHTPSEPIMDGSPSQIYGSNNGGIWVSENTHSFQISQTSGKLFLKTLLPNTTKVYKMGGYESTTTTSNINNNEGTILGGTKLNIDVVSTAGFPDKPVVTIEGIGDDGPSRECFMCEGKSANQLLNCIRGKRYFAQNFPLTISSGSNVKQEYAWMVREADTGDWISYPYDFGYPHDLSDLVKDIDEHGRWALHIETKSDEIHSNFLHVLHPTTAMDQPVMSDITLIDSDNMAGSFIQDSANQWVAVFSKKGDFHDNLSYTANYVGNTKHLITGLEYAVYDIYKEGTKIDTKTASEQNSLYFESAGGGTFEIVKSGNPLNSPPVASITNNVANGHAPLSVDFTGSGTDTDGNVVSYHWSFADGATSTQQNPSHIFASEGSYEVTLTVTDDRGAIGRASVIISVSDENNPPTASISADTTSGEAPLTIQFTGSGTDTDGTIVSYTWDFGDMEVSTEQNPIHTYINTGTYTAFLKVADDDGAIGGMSVSINVSSGGGGVGNNPPTAYSTADRNSGNPPLTIHFTGIGTDSDGTVVSYLWNFGDGSTSNQQNPEHTYNNVGFYTASLTVTDNSGAKGIASLDISVYESSSFPYVINDFNFYPVPAIAKPQKGITFQDPVFHTNIVRITDAANEAVTIAKRIQCGYNKWDIENANGSRIVFPNRYLWNAKPPYDMIGQLPRDVWDTKDPDLRWDNEAPEILYSTYETFFLKYNVITGKRTVLHDFSNDFPSLSIYRIYTAEEGDASDDRRYWAFIVRCYDVGNIAILVYDKDFFRKDSGKVISVMYDSDPDWEWDVPNFISMSPSGNYVHVGAPPSWILDRNLNIISRINTHGHVDLAIDNTGREVLVWTSRYWAGYTDMGIWAKMADIETGDEFWLAPFGNNQFFHVSGNCHDKPGWALITNYVPLDYTGGGPTEWSDASLLVYELTREYASPDWNNHGKVWRVAHTHMLRKSGVDDPFAKFNKKGTKIWFGSAWNQCFSETGAPYNVYQINLPPTWHEDLSGGINLAPVSSISANLSSGTPPLTVEFTGTGTDSDGTIASYLWDFGDGSSSNHQSNSHTYSDAGYFRAMLTVTDDDGAVGRSTISILATQPASGNSSPTAYLSASPTIGNAALEVDFVGSATDSDGTVASYTWTFGDGHTSDLQSTAHVFENPDNYTVTLTVVDDNGAATSTTVIVNVTGDCGIGDVEDPEAPTGLSIQ